MQDLYFILIQSFFALQIRNEMENKCLPSKNVKKNCQVFLFRFQNWKELLRMRD